MIKEALKMALEALEHEAKVGNDNAYFTERQAIKEALEQPEQEPDAPDIAVVDDSNSQTNTMSWAINLPLPIGTPLYTSPPAKPWVGLTDEEFSKAAFDAEFHKWFGYDWEKEGHLFFFKKFVEAIEAKLKEKNGL